MVRNADLRKTNKQTVVVYVWLQEDNNETVTLQPKMGLSAAGQQDQIRVDL